jgi:hypothetical protein
MASALLRSLVVAALLGAAPAALAQIDPERRANLEVGVEGPLRGDGPLSGYAFFLWNRPHFVEEDWYLRVILAPTFVLSELVVDRWPAEGHAVGGGLGGGLFPYNVDEFRGGRHLEGESFWGHGGEATLSYYRRLLAWDVLPIEGQLRLRPQYVVYDKNGTDAAFRLPADTPILHGRAGIRVGGVPPELLPDLALELSVWYEASYRAVADPYGFDSEPRALEHLTDRAWARTGGIAKLPGGHSLRAFATAGTAERTDALSSFRMGSGLPFRSEFPLVLHGYYVDEIFARRFALVNLAWRFPLGPAGDRVKLQLSFDYARVDYAAGHDLPRHGLRGAGADLCIQLTPRATLVLGYGYGFDAPRGHGFGGHEAQTLLELRF